MYYPITWSLETHGKIRKMLHLAGRRLAREITWPEFQQLLKLWDPDFHMEQGAYLTLTSLLREVNMEVSLEPALLRDILEVLQRALGRGLTYNEFRQQLQARNLWVENCWPGWVRNMQVFSGLPVNLSRTAATLPITDCGTDITSWKPDLRNGLKRCSQATISQ